MHVRLATGTRGHVFVALTAYRTIQELTAIWRDLDVRPTYNDRWSNAKGYILMNKLSNSDALQYLLVIIV
jgi:hypothetical protein